MMKHLGAFALLCWFLAPVAPAATYYVAPTGSDSNPGSQAQPWASIGMGFTNAVAGDTVLLAPGNYGSSNSWLELWTQHDGTSNAPIVIRGTNVNVGTATATDLKNSWWVIDGLTFHYTMWVRATASDCIITNCTFTNFVGGGIFFSEPVGGGNPANAAQRFTIINNVFDSLINGQMLTLQGAHHLVQGNVFANGISSDAVFLFGSNVVVRANLFTNMVEVGGYGNHPDILQTFGDNGAWMVDYLFEQNYVVNCPIQLTQFEQTAVRDNTLWGIVIRNNVFKDSNMQSSIDLPNVRFYNNTFYRCSNGGALLDFSFCDPNGGDPRGMAYGGQVINNAFIECSGTYAAVAAGPAQGPLTTADAGGGSRTGGGYAKLNSYDGTLTVSGVYSNLSGTVTGVVLYYYPVNSNVFNLPANACTNGVIYYSWPFAPDPGTNGWSNGAQWAIYNGHAFGFRILTTTFGDGEISGPLPAYVPSPAIDIVVDYNYATAGAVGTHGLTSGTLNLVSTNWPVPMPGSALIDAGTNLSGLGVTNDYVGNTRPQGGGFDIGAFEYSGSGQTSGPPVAPSLTAQPQNASVSAGSAATFSVAATGTAPLSYQWQFNGANITGVASSAFTKNSVQASDAGSYSVVVSNAAGSVTSASAVLTVTAPSVPPSLTAQPQSATVNAGGTATFSVAASGTAPLNYQWQFNGAGIAGATFSTCAKSDVQAGDAGGYSVVVANAAGSITSASAVLTVTAPSVPLSLTAQPQGATVNPGGTATFSVAATGTAPLSYQWQFSGANIAGATSSTYTKNNVQASDAGSYSVVVANAAGSITSASAVLTVTAPSVPPSLTAQPQGASVNAGNTATFSVAATGTAPLSYQWRFSGANISGATGSTYARAAVQSADAGIYSVVVANLAGTVTSADAWLIVTNSVITVGDSRLKLHLDFDEDFSSGQVVDTSGNGNDGWQFNPTNRLTPAPGVLGGTAAQFSSPGTYLAVTNLAGFAYLTNGTLSLWAKFAPNGDLAMRLLDNGYTPGYSGNPAAASNSWALCRDYTPYLTFLVYPSGSAGQRLVSWPDDTVRSGGSQPDLSTTDFHLYSVTIDCPNNQAIAYYDGQPWMTNSINLPWIRVYGCAGQPWLCIGAASSDGTPQWGDDAYPSYGFFAGSLDDLRIYNRTLSAANVKALYTGRPAPPPPLALRILNP